MSTRIVLTIGPVFLLLAGFGFAQVSMISNCPADVPITVNANAGQAGASQLTYTIKNTGQRPISAVVLSWKVTGSSGIYAPSTSTIDYAPSGKLLLPNEAVEDQIALSFDNDTARTAEVSCKAVLYQGGEGWGDMKAAEVKSLKTRRAAIGAERKRLLSIFNKDGQSKLLEELNRPLEP